MKKAVTVDKFLDVQREVDQAAHNLRWASYHLALMWDALRRIESLLEIEVESPSPNDLAIDFDVPASLDNGPDLADAKRAILAHMPKTLQVMLSDGGE